MVDPSSPRAPRAPALRFGKLPSDAAASGPASADDAPNSWTTPPRSAEGIVSVREGRFRIQHDPYAFVGANLWFAAYLGAKGPTGDRPRLCRELDRLAALGVDNLRVLASSELSPLRAAVRPTFRDATGAYSTDLLEGLDFALAEMKKRGQRAVLYLTNFWEWSGGMMTYLSYVRDGRYIDMGDPAHPWPEFPDATAEFYGTSAAVALYHDYVRAVVGRTNSVTGVPYRQDPTLFAWQLCNEPRPGQSAAVAAQHIEAYVSWVAQTARLIKSLDPEHMVSTGSEGIMGSAMSKDYYLRAHDCPDIDYLTAHVWPQNWDWIRPDDLAGTFGEAEARSRSYIQEHIDLAATLGRPLVIEEFGFPRDGGSFAPDSATQFRDRFYALIYDTVLASVRADGPLSGSNFWAFSGEGRAEHADYRMRPGDTRYLGDPSHEPQGWYSVFDSDASTGELIRGHARALREASSSAHEPRSGR